MDRYIALQNDGMGEGPLKQYFLGETMQMADVGIFEANMYLAEDRVSLLLRWNLWVLLTSLTHRFYVGSS
jgi:hypothetical protein